MYGPLVFFAKLSVLLQLQHIFATSRRQPVFFVIQALIWANLAVYLAYLWVEIFQCVPDCDLGTERARHMYFNGRHLHFTRGYQHRLGLPDFGAPDHSGLSIADDAEE